MSEPQWAPDPYGRFERRYWDGATWTEHVHHQGVPGLDPVPAQPTVRPAARHEDAWPLAGTEHAGPDAGLFPGAYQGAGSPQFDAYVQQGQAGRTGGRAQHGRTTTAGRGRGPLVVVGAAGAALLGVVVLGVVVLGVAALGGGQDAAVLAGASGTSTQQGFAAVPTSNAPPAAAPAAASAAGRGTSAPAARASTSKRATPSTTTTARTTTTTGPRATTTKPRTTTSAPRTTTSTPRTTSTKPRTTKPSTTKPSTTTPATTATTYTNCTAMHVDYPHGVGLPGAVDSTSGTPVTSFTKNAALYRANAKSDRDDDSIACEQR